ncbi:MAG: cation:proton antiporter [Verrucomicrobiota bacterium]|jgi:Kef-type K+ transport system membrane component KefB/mannitol/fructose-specific phosphotransferase system IIA component (Ntr-type)|nr:cation:proton antiporter [Verrucomicrobiota bacterium]
MRDRIMVFLALAACASPAFAGGGGVLQQDWAVPSARFILQLGVLAFAAKMGGLLFHRWGVSRVVGEVAAGVLLGPALLGGLPLPFFSDGLMSDAASWFTPGGPMYGIISLALVVFFFIAGLDTDVRQFRQAKAGGVATGLAGFALCFAVTGWLFSLALHTGGLGDPGPWSDVRGWLLGAAVSMSSVGMLARMLAARQRFESPAGTVALTAALTDNAAGLFLFTIFAGAYAAGARRGAGLDWPVLASVAGRAVLAGGAIALCGLPVARWVNGLALRERAYPLAFAVAVACLLVAAGAAGAVGLPALSGAYVTGLVFAATDMRYEIRERLDFFSAVLVPVCFAALGMSVAPGPLGQGLVWIVFGVSAAIAIAAKGCGNAAAGLFAGLNRIGCLRVGAALLPRGELTLALLAAATCMGICPESIRCTVLMLVALTCLSGPRLVEALFARGGSGTRKPSETAGPVKLSFQFSSHQTAMLMINRAVEIFEDDGFYAHRLNRYQAHYRLSRAGQAVHLSAEAGTVTVECSERERPLINAVMLELSSGVEQSLRELQKPLDDVLLRKNMQRAVPAATSAALLKNRFAAETLKPRLLATTKQGAISELVSLLYENGLVMDRERAVQAVFERERGLSTGLEFGLAIPHARTDAVSRLVCAVGLKKEGLDFDAADGKPARIVVLVLAPDNASAPQLQLIAQVCRQLDEKGRAALLACETAEDMFTVLAGGGGAAAAGTANTLAAVLQWQSVSLDLASADPAQALSLLLALCARSGAVGAVEEVRAELQARGPLAPERVGDDAALLAVETPNVFRTVAALGVSAGAGGGRRRVCVLLLYPPSAAAGLARVKEALARALDADGLAALLAAKTSKEALAVLMR